MALDWVSAFIAFNIGIVSVLLMRRAWHHTRVPSLAYALWSLPVLMAIAAAIPMAPEVRTITIDVLPTWTTETATPRIVPDFPWVMVLTSLSLTGSYLLLMRLVFRHRRLVTRLAALPSSIDPRAGSLIIKRADAGPALVGLLRPTMVLPHDFEQRFTPRQQELAIAHELAHWRSGDVFVRLIVWAIACLQWWNPLVWFALPRFVEDQELANDARVLKSRPDAIHEYAQTLVRSLDSPSLPMACAMRPSHPLLRRIAMLPAHSPSRRTRRSMIGLTALSLFAATGLAVAVDPGSTTSATQHFHVDIALVLDDQPASRFGLGGPAGEPMAAKIDGAGSQVDFTLIVEPTASPEFVMVDMTIARDGTTIAEPKLKLKLGGEGGVQIGSDVDGKFSSVGLDLTVQNGAAITESKSPTNKPSVESAKAAFLRSQAPVWQTGVNWINQPQDPGC